MSTNQFLPPFVALISAFAHRYRISSLQFSFHLMSQCGSNPRHSVALDWDLWRTPYRLSNNAAAKSSNRSVSGIRTRPIILVLPDLWSRTCWSRSWGPWSRHSRGRCSRWWPRSRCPRTSPACSWCRPFKDAENQAVVGSYPFLTNAAAFGNSGLI